MSIELLLDEVARLDWRVWRIAHDLDRRWECTLYRLGPADATLRSIVTTHAPTLAEALDGAIKEAGGSGAFLFKTQRLEAALDALLEAFDDRESETPGEALSDDLRVAAVQDAL